MYHYQKNIGDYRSATMHFSLLEHGVYNQLLDWYYLDEEPLSTDNRTLFRRLSAKSEIEQQAVVNVLAEMFQQTEAGWVHKRVCREIALYRAKSQQAREAGKLGGRPLKKGNGFENNRDGYEKEADAKPTANHKPLTINRKPLTKEEMPSAKRSTLATKPDDVCDEVWASWTNLRKTKRAPISATVIEEVRKDSVTAGMSLEAYLRIWCKRGWQGMEPSWIKPQERAGPGALQPNRQEALELRNRAVAEAFVKKLEREDSHASQ
jgi:uncharacterized protein YdaU (DUF1376 family)